MQALEYQMQQGVAEAARQDLYLMPLAAQHEYGPELHSNVCVLKLLQPAELTEPPHHCRRPHIHF